jgi:RimJ/RimL family protein N-acetyltransferase
MSTASEPKPSSERVTKNELGQPVGRTLDGFEPARLPRNEILEGDWCQLTPLSSKAHASDLFAAFAHDADGRDWTYLPYGPFADLSAFEAWLGSVEAAADPFFYAVLEKQSTRAVGLLSLMRMVPAHACIEVGHVHFAPAIQRTAAATEAVFLACAYAFDELGYRRMEWKCDALNERSRRAAQRLGFEFEGVFRQHLVYKDRNRDTAWYAITDREWPAVRRTQERWLAKTNFDPAGNQLTALGATRDPA